MSTEMHNRIKESERVNGELFRLMNSRSGDYGLVNGQLVRYGRIIGYDQSKNPIVDRSKIGRFERHSFKF